MTATARPRYSDARLLKLLWPYAKRHLRLLSLALILLPPLAIADAVQPLILQQALDGPIATGELDGLWWYVALLIVTIIVRSVFQAIEGFISQKLGQLMTTDIRNDLFAHVLALSTSFFDRTPVGKLITRITSDVEALGDVFSTGAIGIVSDIFTLVVIGGVMLSQRWDLGLMLIALVIPMAFLVVWLQQRFRDANYRVREELSSLNSLLQENILGMSIVQLFRREQVNYDQFLDTNQRYIQAVDVTIWYDSVLSAILEWVAWLGIAGLLWIGGSEILAGSDLTFGSLYAFILFSQRFFNPLRQLAEKFTSLQSGFTAVERISDIMSLPIAIRDPAQPITLPASIPGEVRFENVSFAYKADDWVLKNLSFTIKPGEKIAIVGPTGAGKSSIIRLLARLYDVSEGRILIDGIDIRDLPQQELRRALGIILQDSFLFSGSVSDNITLGESRSREAIEAAAIAMGIDPYIRALPQSYDTPVRERGNNLSGGQKQLLAFARALIRDPHVLVLDEATASLDVGTEAIVQRALDQLLQNRTAIIIAHRLATIRSVDRIFVLQRGELKESGSHAELMAQNGIYASLYNLQDLGVAVG